MAKHCVRCQSEMSRKRRDICAGCEYRWTGTHYAKRPVKNGDAMKKRYAGSFEFRFR